MGTPSFTGSDSANMSDVPNLFLPAAGFSSNLVPPQGTFGGQPVFAFTASRTPEPNNSYSPQKVQIKFRERPMVPEPAHANPQRTGYPPHHSVNPAFNKENVPKDELTNSRVPVPGKRQKKFGYRS